MQKEKLNKRETESYKKMKKKLMNRKGKKEKHKKKKN